MQGDENAERDTFHTIGPAQKWRVKTDEIIQNRM